MQKFHSIDILGMRVNMVQIPDIVQRMEFWISNNNCHNYIVVANADSVVRNKCDNKVRDAINNSSLSIPDGFSLLLWGRMHGYLLKKRAYGPDLMSQFLESTANKGYSHFFYGATKDTLDKLVHNAQSRFPGIRIAGVYVPPFRGLTPEEDGEIMRMINDASPSVLWVGIGCPKQEIWMYEHKDKLNVPVMVGVGAAFDYLAGTKPQAPRWMRDSGLEWLFRLINEPKRLWRRYLINNCIFLYCVAIELISQCFSFGKARPKEPN